MVYHLLYRVPVLVLKEGGLLLFFSNYFYLPLLISGIGGLAALAPFPTLYEDPPRESEKIRRESTLVIIEVSKLRGVNFSKGATV